MQVVKRQVIAEPEGTGKRISALSMYPVAPDEQISVTEFEEYAFDRLRCTLLTANRSAYLHAPCSLNTASSTLVMPTHTHHHGCSSLPLAAQCSVRLR